MLLPARRRPTSGILSGVLVNQIHLPLPEPFLGDFVELFWGFWFGGDVDIIVRGRGMASCALSLLLSAGRTNNKMVVRVFGYGSLIWNPGFDFNEKILRFIKGYKRTFNLGILGCA